MATSRPRTRTAKSLKLIDGEATLASGEMPMEVLSNQSVLDADGVAALKNVQDQGVFSVEIRMSVVETGCAAMNAYLKNTLDALEAMVKVRNEGNTKTELLSQATSDHADGAFAMCKANIQHHAERMRYSPEEDPRCIEARKLVLSCAPLLNRVNVQRDSAPGIALCKLLMLCVHQVIHPMKSAGERQHAIAVWREQSRKIASAL